MAEDNTKYRYIDVDLNADDLITNLDRNWNSYADYMGWSPSKRKMAYSALTDYKKAISEGRMYSDSNRSVWDRNGILQDSDPTYWNAAGNPLVVTQKTGHPSKKESVVLNDVANENNARTTIYNNAKRRDTKGSSQFYANNEIATYIDLVAKKMYDQYLETWKKEDEAAAAAKKKADEEEAAKKKKADREKEAAKKKADEEAERKKAETTKFDPKTHGFWAQFMNNLSGGSGTPDWDTIINADEYDTETGRATTNRALRLADYIKRYKDWLDTINWDFSGMGASFKNKDAYKKSLDELYGALTEGAVNPETGETLLNNVNASIYNRLAALGANPEEYKQYFTTEKTYTKPSSSNNTTAANEERQKKIDSLYDQLLSVRNNDSQYRPEPTPTDNPETFIGDVTDKSKFYTNLRNKINALNKNRSSDNQIIFSLTNPNNNGVGWNQFIRQYYLVFKDEDGFFKDVRGGSTYRGWKWLPGSLNPDNYTVLAFNPSTGQIDRVFLGYLGQNAINFLKEELGKVIDDTPEGEQIIFHRTGGSVSKFQGGGTPNIDDIRKRMDEYDKKYDEYRKKIDEDPKQKPVSEGWTTTEKVRLAALACDLAAVLDPESFSSAGLGLVSSIINLGCDIGEKQSFGKTFGNFGVNVGLSAVGLVPVVGGVIGKGSELVKGLAKYAPKIIGWLGGLTMAGNTLINGSAIIDSFKKLGNKDEDLTMDDLRNFLTAFTTLLGGARAVRHYAGPIRMSNRVLTGNKLVPVRNKKTGDVIDMRVFGKDAGKINDAIRNQDLKTLEEEITRLGDGRYELDITSKKKVKVPNEEWGLFKFNGQPRRRIELVDDFDFSRIRDEVDIQAAENLYGERSPLSVKRNIYEKMQKNPDLYTGRESIGVHPGTLASEMKDDALIEAATAYRKEHEAAIKANQKVEHSEFFNELLKRLDNFSARDLMGFGYYNTGGRLSRARRVLKGQDSLKVPENPIELLYGTDYVYDPTKYKNKEYGVETDVDLSAIEDANASLRGEDLVYQHTPGTDYNYRSGQENTDKKVAAYQGLDGAVENDILSAWRTWKAKNPNGTPEEFVAAYNREGVDELYAYKHEMGTPEWTGKNSYRKGDVVSKFNDIHKWLYAFANDPKSTIYGWSEAQKDVNGSTTASRGVMGRGYTIDPTKYKFGDTEDEATREFFNNLQFTESGHLAYPKAPAAVTKAVTPVSGPETGTGTETGIRSRKPAKQQPQKTGTNFFDIRPEILDMTRLGLGLNTNLRLNRMAHKAPVNLEFPKERFRWLTGDYNSIQNGRAAYAELMHRLSNPISSDAAQYTASMMQGNKQGQSYINQGLQLNDTAFQKSREAMWTQMGENQDSRYNTAITNKGRLNYKRISDLSADMGKTRADYESWNNFLSGMQQQAKEFRDEAKEYNNSVLKSNIRNNILADLNNSGVPVTTEEQQLINELQMGTKRYDNLTEAQQARIDSIYSKVEELLAIEYGRQRYGIFANKFSPRTTTSATDTIGLSTKAAARPSTTSAEPTERLGGKFAKGGKTSGDSVTVQKMRSKIQKMQSFQKHLESRMNALEKDMDRMQRGSVYYSKGQRSK